MNSGNHKISIRKTDVLVISSWSEWGRLVMWQWEILRETQSVVKNRGNKVQWDRRDNTLGRIQQTESSRFDSFLTSIIYYCLCCLLIIFHIVFSLLLPRCSLKYPAKYFLWKLGLTIFNLFILLSLDFLSKLKSSRSQGHKDKVFWVGNWVWGAL